MGHMQIGHVADIRSSLRVVESRELTGDNDSRDYCRRGKQLTAGQVNKRVVNNTNSKQITFKRLHIIVYHILV